MPAVVLRPTQFADNLRERPDALWGFLAVIIGTALTTLFIYPLKEIAPAISAGVVYLIPVLLISAFWGLWFGLGSAVCGTLAFNFFHIEPTGRLTVTDPENLVALTVFLIASILTSTLAEMLRSQAVEADQRRLEANITADMARILLGGQSLAEALPSASSKFSEDLGLKRARITATADPDPAPDMVTIGLGDGIDQVIEMPRAARKQTVDWTRERLAPSIGAVVKVAVTRDRLQEQAIEAGALRRSDVMKTALIRSVSHDLRSPLAAIIASGEAMNEAGLDDTERREMSDAVVAEATRLSRLVDNLLDLSRLESGAADPATDWCSVEEVIDSAADQARESNPSAPVNVTVESGLPMVRADAAQLERSLVNLLENGQRYSAPEPVTVSARRDHGGTQIRIVDRGPGIPSDKLDQIFDPFVRLTANDSHSGSGLGLAIARGFVEANGGVIRAESLPGQGAAFVIDLPAGEEPGPETAI